MRAAAARAARLCARAAPPRTLPLSVLPSTSSSSSASCYSSVAAQVPPPLAGRVAVVFGVANKWSLAWSVARAWRVAGARLLVACRSDREAAAARKLLAAVTAGAATDAGVEVLVCDVTVEGDVEAVFAHAGHTFGGRVDCVLHAVAAAPPGVLSKPLLEATAEEFAATHMTSAYSLVSIARCAAPLMAPLDESSCPSITSLTYLGSSRAVPGYGAMGCAKASLESATRYLAQELGPRGIRVNCISAPPSNTLSARGIPNFKAMQRAAAGQSFLARQVAQDEVASCATFLAGQGASGITGQVMHVDGGFSAAAATGTSPS